MSLEPLLSNLFNKYLLKFMSIHIKFHLLKSFDLSPTDACHFILKDIDLFYSTLFMNMGNIQS